MSDWRPAVQLRCGLCDEPLTAPTTRVDDERVHVECARLYAQGEPVGLVELDDEWEAA